jgi:hypothetical protein
MSDLVRRGFADLSQSMWNAGGGEWWPLTLVVGLALIAFLALTFA